MMDLLLGRTRLEKVAAFISLKPTRDITQLTSAARITHHAKLTCLQMLERI